MEVKARMLNVDRTLESDRVNSAQSMRTGHEINGLV